MNIENKINEELKDVLQELMVNPIYIYNGDKLKEIYLNLNLCEFRVLADITNKIRKSHLFDYVKNVNIFINEKMIILEDIKNLFFYDKIHNKYYIKIDKGHPKNIEKIQKIQKIIEYYKKIKYKCILDGCENQSQDSHSISDCFLKKISDEQGYIYGLNLMDNMLKLNKISQDITFVSDLIIKKKTKKASIFQSFCKIHDNCFAIAFENSVSFNEDENNCKLLYYRTINSVYVANKMISETINLKKDWFSNEAKNRIKIINNKNKGLKKELKKISKTKSIIFDIQKTNIMYSGVFSTFDLLEMYAYISNTKFYYPYNLYKDDIISINLFSDNKNSKLILTKEDNNKKCIIDFFNDNSNNLSHKTLSTFFLFAGMFTLNCFFRPDWLDNLKQTNNKKNIKTLSNYLAFGMINNEEIDKYFNNAFYFDFKDESPIISSFKSYKII